MYTFSFYDIIILQEKGKAEKNILSHINNISDNYNNSGVFQLLSQVSLTCLLSS